MPRHEEPQIQLEEFSEFFVGAAFQALRVSKTVRQEADWLQKLQPGTVRRYEKAGKAHASIRRIAQHPGVEAYIIRSNGRTAMGLATIIRDQAIVHPDEGTVRGDDVDYWLKELQPLTAHIEVVGSLCLRQRQLKRPSFATIVPHVDPQAFQKNLAFGEQMFEVGAPAPVETDTGFDTYDVARGGMTAQIYRAG